MVEQTKDKIECTFKLISIKEMNEDFLEKRENLRKCLERTNFWISNCDQKASIILAMVGIFIPMLTATDMVINIVKGIITPIINMTIEYSGLPTFSIICLFFIIVDIYYLFGVLYNLLTVLKGTTDPKTFKREGLAIQSYLHFQSITKVTFGNFKERCENRNEEEELNDYYSQIYINSIICTRKYDNYNAGLMKLRRLLLWMLMTAILVILRESFLISKLWL